MSEFQESGERTEAPTPKRRRDARRKGQVARSQELNSFIILTVGTLLLAGLHPRVIEGIERVFVQFFQTAPESLVHGNMTNIALIAFRLFFPIVTPLFLGVIASGLLVNAGQVGFHVTADALSPKFDRINPINGLKRLLSWRSVFEALKGCVKIGVIGFLIYKALLPAVNGVLSLSLSSSPDIIGTLVKMCLGIALRALIVMAVVAGLDYAFQFWQHEKSIRMTLRELRDELKETEGDPMVRERIRSIQREMSRRRMMEAVKTADVVVTNPTTLAVAITYKADFPAPKIVGKGKRRLAEKIRRIAEEFRVPVVENRPLAWALYTSCKVGGFVPVHLYRAVAEVLAYVYSLKNGRRS
jgi:flagellar biosynthetic protein FlhB